MSITLELTETELGMLLTGINAYVSDNETHRNKLEPYRALVMKLDASKPLNASQFMIELRAYLISADVEHIVRYGKSRFAVSVGNRSIVQIPDELVWNIDHDEGKSGLGGNCQKGNAKDWANWLQGGELPQ